MKPTLARKNLRLSDVGARGGVWRGFSVVPLVDAMVMFEGCLLVRRWAGARRARWVGRWRT